MVFGCLITLGGLLGVIINRLGLIHRELREMNRKWNSGV